MTDLYIARQPIFDASLNIYGYELFYREGDTETVSIEDANQATAHTLTTALIEIGLDNLVGNYKAFINLSRDYVLGTPDLPFPTDKVVLEIAEDEIANNEIEECLKHLASKKYTIAIDGLHSDSIFLDKPAKANIIKIDVSKHDFAALSNIVNNLKKHPVQLIAEKVEDGALVQKLIDIGFDYLQGYFFSRPILSKQTSLSTNQVAIMDLLSKVYDPEITTDELEQAISHDVTLSYHLLKYLNSAFFSLPNKVASIKQAVVYLGRNELKSWATVLSMAGHSSKPDELMTTALIRAKFCESMAKCINDSEEDSYFSVGLLSVLDALMDQPINDIISRLPLNSDLSNALTIHSGNMGAALNAVLKLEQVDWDCITFHDVSSAAMNIHYRNAIQWADDVVKNLGI